MVDNSPAPSITLRERRDADGLDTFVPVILRDGAPCDPDLDRFLLDLPLSGIRSRHSLRAIGYDLMVWVRFLAQARGKGVWQAGPPDVAAYHRVRRREDAPFRISAASWNRAVASLDRLYRWAERKGLVPTTPFAHRAVWVRGHGGRPMRLLERNEAYERAAWRAEVPFLTLKDYRAFRDVGLRGLQPDGTERPGARDRNGVRNALFADLLVTTGLRLEEAACLLAHELPTPGLGGEHQRWLDLPSGLTKGQRARRVLVPIRVLGELRAYLAVERTGAAAKFAARGGWRSMDRPILICRPTAGPTLALVGGGALRVDRLTPEERLRLIACDTDGTPHEPLALWLTEVGQPVRPNSWEAIFARATRRCAAAGLDLRVHPHRLRHTFAVHLLAMLVERRLREAASSAGAMEGYRRLLGDPLLQVQRLLGHASVATTQVYLDHAVPCTGTVDAAVEELLALLTTSAALAPPSAEAHA